MTLLVVLSAGPAAQVKALQADLGQPLALALQGTWDDRWKHLGQGDDPNSALQQLQPPGGEPALGPRPALLGLPLDPGLPLAGGGHWAEAADGDNTGDCSDLTVVRRGWRPITG